MLLLWPLASALSRSSRLSLKRRLRLELNKGGIGIRALRDVRIPSPLGLRLLSRRRRPDLSFGPERESFRGRRNTRPDTTRLNAAPTAPSTTLSSSPSIAIDTTVTPPHTHNPTQALRAALPPPPSLGGPSQHPAAAAAAASLLLLLAALARHESCLFASASASVFAPSELLSPGGEPLAAWLSAAAWPGVAGHPAVVEAALAAWPHLAAAPATAWAEGKAPGMMMRMATTTPMAATTPMMMAQGQRRGVLAAGLQAALAACCGLPSSSPCSSDSHASNDSPLNDSEVEPEVELEEGSVLAEAVGSLAAALGSEALAYLAASLSEASNAFFLQSASSAASGRGRARAREAAARLRGCLFAAASAVSPPAEAASSASASA